MILIKNLNKTYKSEKVLDNLDLQIDDKKVYGLIGRNGIGKSTLLNILGSRIKRDSGSILLNGREIYENQALVEQIVLIKENEVEFEYMTIKDIFNNARNLYKNWNEEKFNDLVYKFSFKNNLKKNYSKLSRGNKSILGIILGISSDSEYLLLDEPTLGMDAVNREIFNNIIYDEMEDNERTIIISTHNIDETSKIYEEVIILNDGNICLKEKTEVILENAYLIMGDYDNIYNKIKDKNIIDIESLGNTSLFYILDNLSFDEKEALISNGNKIEKIGLQKLFVYLTKDKEDIIN